MKHLVLILISFIAIKSFSQNDLYYCSNFYKEALKVYNYPDTLMIIDNSTPYTLIDKEWDTNTGRNIVFIFKRNDEWFSAYCMITVEKDKWVWYQTFQNQFDCYTSKKTLVPLFDTCFSDLQKLISYKAKHRSQNSGKYICVYMKQGDSSFDIYYNTPGTGDIIGLLNSDYKSIYDAYTLGLTHSITMQFIYKNTCDKINYPKTKEH